MNWTYKLEQIEDISQFPTNTYGFVYMTTHKPTGKSYIGKKILHFTKKAKLGKKELESLKGTVGRRPSYKMVVKESDWKTYYGSQDDIKRLLVEKKHEEFERVILKCVENKKLLTYFETKYQFTYHVLEKPNEFYNNNILGKFYTKDLLELDTENYLESPEN